MTAPTAARDERRLLEFAETLRAGLGDLRQRMDRERQLPAGVAGVMNEAGYFRLLTPRSLGGLELDPLAAARVVEALARIEGSLGWSAMIASQSAWFSGFLDAEAAAEVFRPGQVVAGALKPGGRATPVEGGYRVTGRWQLASGCTHATWLYGASLVVDPNAGAPSGPPEVRVLYVPVAEAQIHDTWRSVGLRGTGSHDFSLDDVMVPVRRTIPFPQLGEPQERGPLYRDRILNLVFISQAAQALGMAQAAFDEFVALAPSKRRWTSNATLRDEPAVQAIAAEAWANLRSARAWLLEVAGDVWATIEGGQPPSMTQRMHLRLAITHGIRSAVEAGEALARAAGSAAVYEDDPLGRIGRDLATAAAHVQATPRILEVAGAYLLGDDSEQSPGLV